MLDANWLLDDFLRGFLIYLFRLFNRIREDWTNGSLNIVGPHGDQVLGR